MSDGSISDTDDAQTAIPNLADAQAVAAMERFLDLEGDFHKDNTDSSLCNDSSYTLDVEKTDDHLGDPPTGYEILGLLGRGGMGVVYKARHLKLNRIVALKMILAGAHASASQRVRFLAEAEAVAGLQHSNIVNLLEFGEHQGLPYFTLEYMSGGSLADRLRGAPLSSGDSAQLIARLARAIHFAHCKGIVHRDLKPANILFSENREPKIADFGLARRVESQTGLTGTGDVLGTPSYMAPEQAGGETKKAGPPADVYALGAILYECLTGRPPFRAATTVETLLQVIGQEPVSVHQLQPHLPADLATICHKCLQKEPNKRYSNGLGVALDCEAFLEGRPIIARPVGPLERAWRWCRRNEVVAALIAIVALTLVIATIFSTVFAIRAETARKNESDRAEAEAEAKQLAQDARRHAQRQLVDLTAGSGQMAAREGDHSLALLWFAREVQLAKDEPEQQELNRIRVNNYLKQAWLPQGEFSIPGFRNLQDRVRSFQFSPDGNYLLVLVSNGDCLVWDCRDGQRGSQPTSLGKLSAAVWEPKNCLLAIASSEGKIRLLSAPAFEPTEEIPASEKIAALSFSADGRRLAWGGSEGAQVWDRDQQKYACPILLHTSPVATLSFSNSGDLIATSTLDSKAWVFRVSAETQGPLFPPVSHTRREHGLAHGGADRIAPRFAADDKLLLTVETALRSKQQSLVWRNTNDGKLLLSSDNERIGESHLAAFVVSPRGDMISAVWESKGLVWDAKTRKKLGTIATIRSNWFEDVEFSPDSKSLVTSGHSKMIQSWSLENRWDFALTADAPPLFHPVKPVRATYSSGGNQLAVALWDGTIRLWRKPRGLPLVYSRSTGGITLMARSPDGRFVLPRGTTYRNGTQIGTRVYDANTGEPAGAMIDPGGIILNAIFDPTGKYVITASSTAQTSSDRLRRLFELEGKSGNIQIWEWKSGGRIAGPIATPGEPRGLAMHPSGHVLAVVCADYRVILVSPENGVATKQLDPGIRTRPFVPNLWWGNGEARFSPDGRFLVTWEMAGPVHVWDSTTGDLLQTLAHDERVEDVTFSPKVASLLATVGRDTAARVWNLETGELRARLKHPSHSYRVRFSPDGARLLTACYDGMLRVWDWNAGELMDGLLLHDSSVMDFGFTGDNRWLISLGYEDVLLTDWKTKTAASPRWHLGSSLNLQMSIPTGDRRLLISGFSRSLSALDLDEITSPAHGTIEQIVLTAELLSGRRILAQGRVIPLTSDEWTERWLRALKERIANISIH